MVVRRDRKKIKLRGGRTHGGGNTKNRRGGGSRGGRGRAGSHKHKFSKYYLDFGVKRKLKPKEHGSGAVINLCSLDKIVRGLLAEKKCGREAGMIVVDGRDAGIRKILGMGKTHEKVLLRNVEASRKAREAVEKAGGKVEGGGESTEAAETGNAGDDGQEGGKETRRRNGAGTEEMKK